MIYTKLPPPPTIVSATNVLSRLLDGLGFRYKWATEGLSDEDLHFKPCASSMSILDLLNHIHHLACVTNSVLNNQEIEKTTQITSMGMLRIKTLNLYKKNSEELILMGDLQLELCKFKPKNKAEEFPFWNLINGPVADALTHVGQITSWRRIAGNPVPKHNPFIGQALNH